MRKLIYLALVALAGCSYRAPFARIIDPVADQEIVQEFQCAISHGAQMWEAKGHKAGN